jgi:hypothetical protein
MAMVPSSEINKIPKTPVSNECMVAYDGKKPVFIGHYWLVGDPAPLRRDIACLDYSVAAQRSGKLCAYRFKGESKLLEENFIWVGCA